ncbi:protease modulator HflK [Sphaerotilus microaerophilus]|jgi:membrane protease subunit HflK|uniref:Protein HflK n=2 Tax=Sphaerotilus microaerophilus TaxID=2914710 RepID=A0ABN6PS59_9BURK|nr:protease modulator HflK [Sphaerotilus sp. FB-5]
MDARTTHPGAAWRAAAGSGLRLVAGAARLALLPRRAAGQAEGATWMSNGRNEGPPDLDELWRDFNKKLGGLFNNKGGGQPPRTPEGGSGGGDPGGPSDRRIAGIGGGLITGVVALLWLGSGFFIVQEGQQAAVQTFGKFSRTVDAGIQFRWPYPFQSHETVNVTQTRSTEVGRNAVVQATGLRDSSMLTQDENIVDIRFTVQWRLKETREFLFENRNVEEAVQQAAESAVREIVGRSSMDSVLYEQRDAIAVDLVKSIQAQLDRLKAGILVVNVNVQSVQAPEQVQAAFDDAFKAGADRERLKNEGQAYANDIIPRARGTAARLKEESEGYRARVIAQAEGDAERFRSVLTEYQKAPAVTRDRLYIDTMAQVYSNVSKVYVDARNGSNLLYLPLDKLIQQSGAGAVPVPAPAAAASEPAAAGGAIDVRSRDGQRGRDRDSR